MSDPDQPPIRGQVIEEETAISLDELCRACAVKSDEVLRLVEEGVIEPSGNKPMQWRFEAVSIRRVRRAHRLRRDLGVNLAGVALALELLEELEGLRARLRRYEGSN
jgi:chaperone modulatory protein CbpM